jgi:hypothetical protein
MEQYNAHIHAKESIEEELLRRPGVTGVGVGTKYVGGKPTGQVAIQVFVKEKKKNVPAAEMVPAQVNGVPTDVIERTFFPQPAMKRVLDVELQSDTGTYNPVKGGISIGPCRTVGGFVFAGTLGLPVRDHATGNPLLLSNFHVMCVDSTFSIGDQMTQPSRIDTGSCPSGVVGTLLRAQLTASVDAAVCTLSGRGSSCEIVDIGAVAGTNTAALNMAVRKRGRTTGLTSGSVDSISLSVSIDYGDGIGVKTLTNQIGIQPDKTKNPLFSDHGDSGSVVVDGSNKVIGLLFAGSSDGSSVANPIAAVLAALNIDLCVSKSLIKDFKDGKREKNEIKEIRKDKLEKLEIKEIKIEKIEKREKIEKIEVEGGPKQILDVNPKGLVDNPVQTPTNPIDPGPVTQAPGALEQRVAGLEQAFQSLSAFIGSELRPDLSRGALTGEADVRQTSQELEKQAADAMQAKLAFDNKQ